MKSFLSICLLLLGTFRVALTAQCPGSGTINPSFSSATQLDPDGDGYILKDPLTSFSDCTGELAEFEELTNPAGCSSCQVPWTAIGVDDIQNDLFSGGGCGNTDIVNDNSGDPNFAYFTIFDPDGNCDNGDELIAFRLRISDNFSGNFSYDFLVSNDGLLGTADPDGLNCCGKTANAGFEYEVQLKTGGSGSGINVYNINGVIGEDNCNPSPCRNYNLSTNAQKATACGSLCGCRSDPQSSGDPVFLTFLIRLADLGADCTNFSLLSFVPVTSTSGNPIIAGCNSVSDVGGIGKELTIDCPACAGVDFLSCDADDMACALSCAAERNAFSQVLPVDFISFEAKAQDGKAVLNWITASETNNSHFVVERSPDGLKFEELQLVPGAGNSLQVEYYHYTDEKPSEGYNYYRINQIDYNGKNSKSKIETVWIQTQRLVKVFPSLATDNINISITKENAGPGKVFVFDAGRSLLHTLQFDDHEKYLQMDTGHLTSGKHFLKVVFDNGHTTTETFTVIR